MVYAALSQAGVYTAWQYMWVDVKHVDVINSREHSGFAGQPNFATKLYHEQCLQRRLSMLLP
jgi:hypothetical protein